MQINLELRTPLIVASTYLSISLQSTYNVLTLVLVCEYFKVLTALSLAIQTARL